MREIYFSVDVEADGPYVGEYSMSSFGAVACAVSDTNTGLTLIDVDDERESFYAELKPISENFKEEAAAIAGFDRDLLIRDGESPDDAMPRFENFVLDRSIAWGAKPVFVAWPAPYDWGWVYYYLMRFNNGNSPFGFSRAVNMKDVYAERARIPFTAVGKRNAYKQLNLKARPHTHNALDDAREQGELWQGILGMSGRDAA